jgi:hypothetical protein
VVHEPEAADLVGRAFRRVPHEFSNWIVRERERINPVGRREWCGVDNAVGVCRDCRNNRRDEYEKTASKHPPRKS